MNMENEIYQFALKNALSEIQKVCPSIKNSFMFNEDGELVAGDDRTSEKIVTSIITSFSNILEKADSIGGLEALVLKGDNGRVEISCIEDLYLVTVTGKKADLNYVNTVTRVLLPTILKVVEKLDPTSLKRPPENKLIKTSLENSVPMEEIKEDDDDDFEIPAEPTIPEEPEPIDQKKTHSRKKKITVEPTVNQLIIEDLGGLLVPSDTVRVDNETLSQWEESYDGDSIETVEIETFDGKSTLCKVKRIKDSEFEGKGIIRMPTKIQEKLDIQKGELVRVKPVIG